MNNTDYFDIMNKQISVHDQVLYAVADGLLQVGRVKAVLPDKQGVKILGKGNRREGLIKHPEKQVYLYRKGYYLKHRKTGA